MNPDVILNWYVEALEQAGAPLADYSAKAARSQQYPWTKHASLALKALGKRLATPWVGDAVGATRGSPDGWNKSEYFSCDVTVYDSRSSRPPFFVAEHEAKLSENDVRYACWRILSIKARARVLVTYFGQPPFSTFDNLVSLVRGRCEDTGGDDDRTIVLVAGEWDATPKSYKELRHHHRAVLLP